MNDGIIFIAGCILIGACLSVTDSLKNIDKSLHNIAEKIEFNKSDTRRR